MVPERETIYLMRHAPTEANVRGVILGSQDSPLTREGEELLHRMKPFLTGLNIGRIFSSPLDRARRTAEIIAQMLQVPTVILAELSELSAGRFEGRVRSEVSASSAELRREAADRPGGGESYINAESRAAAALECILARTDACPVLVVAHSVINRLLLARFLNRPIEDFIHFSQPHEIILGLRSDGSISRHDIFERTSHPGLFCS